MAGKSRKWYFFFPGAVYANDFVFEWPHTEREARAYVRWWLGQFGVGEKKRLPRGTQVWPG